MANPRSTAHRYAAAALAVAIGAGLQLLFFVIAGVPPPAAALFLLAIGFSAWYGGFGPGILAMILAVPVADLLTVTMDAGTPPSARITDGLVMLVVGVLTNAMMIFRETQAKLMVEREQDASERRRTADHLTQERHRLQTLLEHSPDRIYFKDRESRFVLFSPSMLRNFGCERVEQVLGKSDFDIFTREHAQAAFDDEQEIMRTGNGMINKEEKETWPDGHITWASSTKMPFRDAHGTIIGTFGISRDITERKLADEALSEAKLAAEAANLAKGQFLANMSHEIRTPLSAVVGMAELLMDSGLSPEQREFAEIIHKSGNGLVAMLNDILDFSKNEAGKLELEAIPFDLALAIDDVVQLLAPSTEAKGLELIQRLAPGTPTRLVGDPGRLRQVLSNLIGNAVKFTSSGHVFVDVSGDSADGRSTLRVAISDTGIGIPADKLDQIFDKFTQADTSTTRQYGGTGLGLAICRQIAEAMGGTLRVESEPDAGSTFILTVTLPLANGSQPRLTKRIDLTGVRVLVVEGNALNQRVIAEQLSAWGCVAVCRQRGDEALATIDAERFQLAIIDAQLADGSGLAVGRALRQRPNGGNLGLILLTSIGRRGDAKLVEAAGFHAYLVKPVRQLDLHDALATVWQAQAANDLSGLVTRHSLAETRGHGSSGTYYRRKPG